MIEYLALQRRVSALALEEMRRQNLTGWTFKFNKNKTRLGVCKFRPKRIEISVFHLKSGLPAVLNTVAHEIAHAVVGPHHGHNETWRRKAIELGCDEQRCGVMEAPHSWEAKCPKCPATFKRHRRGRSRAVCSKCLRAGFPPAVLALQWRKVA